MLFFQTEPIARRIARAPAILFAPPQAFGWSRPLGLWHGLGVLQGKSQVVRLTAKKRMRATLTAICCVTGLLKFSQPTQNKCRIGNFRASPTPSFLQHQAIIKMREGARKMTERRGLRAPNPFSATHFRRAPLTPLFAITFRNKPETRFRNLSWARKTNSISAPGPASRRPSPTSSAVAPPPAQCVKQIRDSQRLDDLGLTCSTQAVQSRYPPARAAIARHGSQPWTRFSRRISRGARRRHRPGLRLRVATCVVTASKQPSETASDSRPAGYPRPWCGQSPLRHRRRWNGNSFHTRSLDHPSG